MIYTKGEVVIKKGFTLIELLAAEYKKYDKMVCKRR
ncbi:MAG: prepilin-type N-terminal cleavage/methylation domain-containing protein [Mollicutes bacterium]|jgi:hypothetical protein|nr:prepilin-type N-terminal cleavage/methylation domain-containing protein [Mollicutes bacterium]